MTFAVEANSGQWITFIQRRYHFQKLFYKGDQDSSTSLTWSQSICFIEISYPEYNPTSKIRHKLCLYTAFVLCNILWERYYMAHVDTKSQTFMKYFWEIIQGKNSRKKRWVPHPILLYDQLWWSGCEFLQVSNQVQTFSPWPYQLLHEREHIKQYLRLLLMDHS